MIKGVRVVTSAENIDPKGRTVRLNYDLGNQLIVTNVPFLSCLPCEILDVIICV